VSGPLQVGQVPAPIIEADTSDFGVVTRGRQNDDDQRWWVELI